MNFHGSFAFHAHSPSLAARKDGKPPCLAQEDPAETEAAEEEVANEDSAMARIRNRFALALR